MSKPLGDGIGLYIGLYEGNKTTPFSKKTVFHDLKILLAEAKRVKELERRVEEMQKTLEWYADEMNYTAGEWIYDGENDINIFKSDVEFDNGNRARQALKGGETK